MPAILVLLLSSQLVTLGSPQRGSGYPIMMEYLDEGQRDEEGPIDLVTIRVEYLRPESEKRIAVSFVHRAQMFFIYRADPQFEDRLRILKEAVATKRIVRCSVRRYSGRIVGVAWAKESDQAE